MNRQNSKTAGNTPEKKITSRQVVAMGGIILLVLLYVITLVVAIVDNSASGRLIWMCLFATIAIPMLIWIYIWLYGRLTGRKTLSDPAPGPEEDRKSEILQ